MSDHERAAEVGGVIVAQLGARRHYAVPMAFHVQGRLERFCTDIFLHSKLSQSLLRNLSDFAGVNGLRRLADRQTALNLPKEMISTFPFFGLRYKFNSYLNRSASDRTANWIWGGKSFCERASKKISKNTRSVYAFTSAARELFQRAKAQGAACWLDHATAPRAFEVGLIQEEARRFPGWSQRSVEDSHTDEYLTRQREELELADLVVCGSSFAKRAIVAEGIDESRVLVVPLGVADHLYSTGRKVDSNCTKPLRVLFVGGDGLRKGIAYLGKALSQLGSRNIECRAAGSLELSPVAYAELGRNIELLGPVARSEMPALFRWAEVLVLPSISDTFGMVILEAMAAGIPVIASENTAAPDLMRDGIDGFVIPIRSSDAIADRLNKLALDRCLLEAMSLHARERAGEFTVTRYGERLIDALDA